MVFWFLSTTARTKNSLQLEDIFVSQPCCLVTTPWLSFVFLLYFYFIFFHMAPKLEHLLNSSCFSVTYPPSTEASYTNIHSPTGSSMSQQHSSPFSDPPPYYPGSQMLSLLRLRTVNTNTNYKQSFQVFVRSSDSELRRGPNDGIRP